MTLKYCQAAGCHRLTKTRFCKEHQHLEQKQAQEAKRRYDKKRPSANDRGYDAHWQKVRRLHIQEHPICEMCGREVSRVVHHITPVSLAPEDVYAEGNLMSLCHGCHNALHKQRGGRNHNGALQRRPIVAGSEKLGADFGKSEEN
jgi:5-methylcytosine-specific restriction protein A